MDFTNELIKMNPSRKRPKPGDIFVVQPITKQYYYGKVIKTNLQSNNGAIKGWNLIFIYDIVSDDKYKIPLLYQCKLLIPPQIVNNQGWLKGYFETIAYDPVNEFDQKINYGFKDFLTKKYVDEEGNPLNYEPRYWTDYGLGSYGIVGHDIHKVLANR